MQRHMRHRARETASIPLAERLSSCPSSLPEPCTYKLICDSEHAWKKQGASPCSQDIKHRSCSRTHLFSHSNKIMAEVYQQARRHLISRVDVRQAHDQPTAFHQLTNYYAPKQKISRPPIGERLGSAEKDPNPIALPGNQVDAARIVMDAQRFPFMGKLGLGRRNLAYLPLDAARGILARRIEQHQAFES